MKETTNKRALFLVAFFCVVLIAQNAIATDLTNIANISAGGYATCAISQNGSVYCWGGHVCTVDEYGSVENYDDTVVPAPLCLDDGMRQISFGDWNFCATSLNGTIKCWGYDVIGGSDPTTLQYNFTMISIGRWHFCGLTSDGTAYCWGDNYEGELGDGSTTNRETPTKVSGGYKFKSITSGLSHTCGVLLNGDAMCWGLNYLGQVGDGSKTGRLTPTPVQGGYKFSSLIAAEDHTCGLTESGSILCWGENNLGQLGDGTTTDRSSPTSVSGGNVYTAVSTGSYHTCGLISDGSVQCWGLNNFGQLGDGTTNERHTPSVNVLGGHKYMSIASGIYHTCGLLVNGSVNCWGSNGMGQLGNGITDDKWAPVKISENLKFTSISLYKGHFTSEGHTCGITTEGTAYCWGDNRGGLGDGTRVGSCSPKQLYGGHKYKSISAGRSHSCGILTNGTAMCWGSGYNGQIGQLNKKTYDTPTPVYGSYIFNSLTSGELHNCGLLSDGTAKCWGDNEGGQIGGGTTDEEILTPTPVTGGYTFSSIASGSYKTCGLLLNGSAMCWGEQPVGDGTDVNKNYPTAVSGGFIFSSIDIHDTSCGLQTNGSVICWGDLKVIGHQHPGNELVPYNIGLNQTLTQISVGEQHICGIMTNGDTICWGMDNSGQLGDGIDPSTRGFPDGYYPVTVAGGHKFAKIFSGEDYSCGLESDGTAYCWGDNTYCQLGVSNFEASPVKVVMEIQTQTTTTLTTTTTTGSSTTTTMTEGCTLPGDSPPCGQVSLNEVLTAITDWASGHRTLGEVLALITAWATG